MSTDITKASQCNAIRRYLEQGKTITSLEAINLFGCGRLAARIYDLKKLGHNISKIMKKRNGKCFAEYFMQ